MKQVQKQRRVLRTAHFILILLLISSIPAVSGVLEANFYADTTVGSAPLTVQFWDTSDGPPTGWSWDFGDGNTSTDQNPLHTYNYAGFYTVNLTVTNATTSNLVDYSDYISVDPITIPDALDIPTLGSRLSYDPGWWNIDSGWGTRRGSARVSPDPGSAQSLSFSFDGPAYLFFDWKLDADIEDYLNVTDTSTSYDLASISGAYGEETREFSFGPGSHNIEWKFARSGSSSYGDAWLDNIRFVSLPSTDFSVNVTSGLAPRTVLFNNTPDDYSLYLSHYWSFGDGTYQSTTGENVTHTYTRPGMYSVSLTRYYTVGADDTTKTNLLSFSSLLPYSKFSANASHGAAPLPVKFTDSSVNATSWSWSFGDGVTSTLQSPVHTYAAAGNYSVSLTTTNSAGSDTLTLPDYISVPVPASVTVDWQKSLGGSNFDYGSSINATSDGGYIITGYTSSNDGDVSGNHGGLDVWVVKLDSSGNIVWQKTLGGSENDYANTGQQTSDGGYILTGYTYSNNGDVSGNHGYEDIWVVKLDSSGNIVWQKCLGGTNYDYGNAIQQTSDNGYIITGYTYSNHGDVSGNHGGADVWVVKLDSSGTILWQKCLGGTSSDIGYDINQTSDNGYIITGYTGSNNGDVSGNHGSLDIWVVKLDSSGTIVWQKTLGGFGDEYGYAIRQTSDEGYVVTGMMQWSTDADLLGHHGYADAYVAKLDSSGTVTWERALGGTSYDYGQSVRQTADGGYSVIGYTYSNDGDVSGNHGTYDIWVVKLNGAAGAIEWQKTLGGTSYDYGRSTIQEVSENRFILTSSSYSNNGDVSGNHGNVDAWVAKIAYSTLSAPVTSFTTNVTYGTAPLAVTFTDSSTNTPIAWNWSFGDGTYSTLQNPSHSYASTGTYTVALNATNVWGSNVKTKVDYITVLLPSPVAGFTGTPTTGGAPLSVSFTDSSTNTPTGWAWFFGDETYKQAWTQMKPNDAIGWSTRDRQSAVSMPDGSIVLMGGWSGTYMNDTWRSTDHGATWVQMNTSGGWRGSENPGFGVMPDGSIVLMGGWDGSVYLNDVWRSTDKGATWVEMKPNDAIGWSKRSWQRCVVMSDGSIVLMGGSDGSNKNDVWNSTDNGATWTLVNTSAGWSRRYGHSSVAMPDGSIVLMGGDDGSLKNDVWRSRDNGTTWALMNASSGWSARSGHSSVAMPDGSIVLMGGEQAGSSYTNDVWRSTDNGNVWTLVNESAGWNGRRMHSGVALPDGSIVLMGGSDPTVKNDVWQFKPVGSSAQNPSHTYTAAGVFQVALQAFNTSGYNSTRRTGYITVTGLAPVASLTANITSGTVPLTVQFNETSTNTPTTWNWSFGDGQWSNTTTATLANVSHTFSSAGTYTVNLTVSNSGGSNTSSRSNYIVVNPPKPIPAFSGTPTTGTLPLTVSFTDGSLNTPTGWAWFFGDENFTAPWTQMNASAEWSERDRFSSVAMPDGSIVLMGGYYFSALRDVWRSMDNGTKWTQMNASAEWSNRYDHSSVVMPDGSIILMGGWDGMSYMNDVWRSMDNGKTWTQVNASAWLLGRYGHSSVVMPDGSIILTGGSVSGTPAKNDTWRSIDNGATWTQVNTSSGWSARQQHSSVAMPDGSIVLMGGEDSSYNKKNDVWRSTDNGAIWTQMNASAGWSARYDHNNVVMPDGSIVLMGGDDGSNKNDVWRSTDSGNVWTRVNASAGWSARYSHNSVAMPDGGIVLMGGNIGGSRKNDVWRFIPVGSSVQNPSHTYTSAGVFQVALQAFNTGGYNSTRKAGHITVTGTSSPVASFTANISSGTAPLAVQFNDTSTNTPTAWNWSFKNVAGNNTQVWWSTIRNATQTFGAGNYSIAVNASNSAGYNISTQVTFINVTAAGLAPVANLNGTPTSGTAPLTVKFMDDSTNNPTIWNWSFGDGSLVNATVQDAIHTYTSAGTYTVSLNATNLWGSNTSTWTNYITVNSSGSTPIANFAGTPTSGTAPLTVSFTDTSLNLPTGWSWFFGDENYTAPWTQQTASAGWTARDLHSSVSMPDGSVVLMGGADGGYPNDTWRSTNKGVTWTQLTSSAGWLGRDHLSSVVLPDGSIVMMGGTDGTFKNDVWRSTDKGATWSLQTASAGWTPRHSQNSVALGDGSIVLIGGVNGIGGIPAGWKTDVWRSTDKGVTWSLQTASAGWTARWGYSSVLMPDGSIVLMGGYDGSPKNDTWRSTDKGATWSRLNASAGWTARELHSSVAMPDGSIVLIGGADSTSRKNDVWRSTDNGATWARVNLSAGWLGRQSHSSVPMPDGSILITGGYSDSGRMNDVWRFVPYSSSLQNPSHTYTAAGTYQVAMLAFNDGRYNRTPKTGYITVNTGTPAPVASFSTNVTNGTVPFAVQFTDTSTGSPTSWNWDFGDANTSTLQNPVYTFVLPQVFNVTLKATNSGGSHTSAVTQITGFGKKVETTTVINGTTESTVNGKQVLSVNTTTIESTGGSVTNTSTTITITGGNTFWNNTQLFAENVALNTTTGDYTVTNMTQVVMQSAPVSVALNESVGTVSVSLDVALKQYVSDAPVNITITQGATTNTVNAFQLAAQDTGLSIKEIAYTVQFTNTQSINANLTQNTTRQSKAVILTMNVKHSWVVRFANSTNNLGRDSIAILRYPETGDPKFLTTRFDHYDPVTGLDWFEADSPDGLSIFGMIGYSAQQASSSQSSSSSGAGNAGSSSGGSSGSSGAGKTDSKVAAKEGVSPQKAPHSSSQFFQETATLNPDKSGLLPAEVQVQSIDQVALITLPQGIQATDTSGQPLTEISLQPKDSSMVPPREPGTQYAFSGLAYKCGPDGAQFSPPVTLTLTLTPDQWSNLHVNGREPVIRTYSTSAKRWESLATKNDPDTLAVSADVAHFSDFALFSKPVQNGNASAVTPAQNATAGNASKSPANAFEIMAGLGLWGSGLIINNPLMAVIGIIVIGIGYVGWVQYRKKKERDFIMYGRRK